MKKIAALPTLVTLGNLLSGFGAITFSMRAAAGYQSPWHGPASGNLLFATLLIGLAMICDVFDGRIARVTNTTSRFGEEMDSLADLISFGVAPAFIVKVLIDLNNFPRYYGWVLVALYVTCGALRLARYNVESAGEKTDWFVGLPIPAAAGAAVSWVLLHHSLVYGQLSRLSISEGLAGAIVTLLPFYVFLLGPMMTSRIRYLHLGKKLLRGEKSFAHLVALVIVGSLLAMQFQAMICLGFNCYVAVGLVYEAYRFATRKSRLAKARGSTGTDPTTGDTPPEAPSPAAEETP